MSAIVKERTRSSIKYVTYLENRFRWKLIDREKNYVALRPNDEYISKHHLIMSEMLADLEEISISYGRGPEGLDIVLVSTNPNAAKWFLESHRKDESAHRSAVL